MNLSASGKPFLSNYEVFPPPCFPPPSLSWYPILDLDTTVLFGGFKALHKIDPKNPPILELPADPVQFLKEWNLSAVHRKEPFIPR